jgi:hypothetical protein
MRTKTLLLILGTVAVTGLVLTSLAVYAQDQPGFQGGGQQRPQRGDRAQWMGMMGRMGGGAAIAVAGDYVYVVYMGTLFKVSADTLTVEHQVALQPQGLPMGGRPGAPGAPGAPAAGAGQ